MGFRRSWSEDQIKEIKKLHDVNMLPFSLIAEKFNTTKNSIIGVYWRSNNMEGRKRKKPFKRELPPDFISKNELKKILGVSMGTLNTHLKTLPHIKMGNFKNSRVFFNVNVIFKFIEEKYGNNVLKEMNKKGIQ